MAKIKTIKVADAESRSLAFHVMEKVYLGEKKWIHSVADEIPEHIPGSTAYSWFLATRNEKPVGVIRLLYDPPLEFPPEFKVSLNRDVDLVKIAETCKFVEIGRFMILPEYRRNIMIALRLMQIAVREVVERDYTHFITDVFEGEPHSPLKFHTRVLGFEVVGTHLHGELDCSLTRIILTLDILKAYKRLKDKKNRVYWTLTDGVREILDRKLVTSLHQNS